jgi:hypothetical protein
MKDGEEKACLFFNSGANGEIGRLISEICDKTMGCTNSDTNSHRCEDSVVSHRHSFARRCDLHRQKETVENFLKRLKLPLECKRFIVNANSKASNSFQFLICEGCLHNYSTLDRHLQKFGTPIQKGIDVTKR